MPEDNQFDRRQSDHDLLIEVRTTQNIMLRELRDLQTGTTARLVVLENGKVDAPDYEKFADKTDKRLTFIERYVWGAIGIIALLQLIGIGYLVSLINH